MSSPEIKHDLFIKFGSEYGPEEERAVLEVLHQNAPTSGDACIQFEKDFAAYCGTQYARCVSNGTAALFMSMVALDIKPGDRVITTPMTWIATPAAAVTLGAEIDFVDIDPHTYNLDAAQLAEDGFEVFPYCTEDLVLCERLVEVGCKVLMPWGAPIGSGRG